MRGITLAVILKILAAGCDLRLMPQAAPVLELQVRDYARIPNDIRSGAKEELARIFQEIGVMIRWVDVTEVGATVKSDSYNVNILSRSILAQRQSRDALGVVDSRTRMAYIFYERVEMFVNVSPAVYDRKQATARILAYAIGHELGHILLPSIIHSSRGIMRSRWDTGDVKEQAGTVFFTFDQGEIIRKQLVRQPN